MLRRLFAFFICLIALLCPLGGGYANDFVQSDVSIQERDFDIWETKLDSIHHVLKYSDNLAAHDSELRAKLSDMRRNVLVKQDNAENARKEVCELLKTIGGPSKDTFGESPALRQKRQLYTDRLAMINLYIAQTKILIVRVDILTLTLAKLVRKQMIASLVKLNPVPWEWQTIYNAASEFHTQFFPALAGFTDWQDDFDRSQFYDLLSSPWLWLTLIYAVAAAIASVCLYRVKQNIVRRLENPRAFASHHIATLAFVAQVVLPCSIMGSFLWLVNQNVTVFLGPFLTLFNAVGFFFIVFLCAFFMPRILLKPIYGPGVAHRISLLGIIYALNTLVFGFSKTLTPSEDILSVSVLVMTLFEACFMLRVLSPVTWRMVAKDKDVAMEEEGGASGGGEQQPYIFDKNMPRVGFWGLLRFFFSSVFVLSFGLQFFGYGRLGWYIIHNLSGTLLALGALSMMMRFVHAWFMLALETHFAKKWLGLSDEGETILQFWINILLSLFFLACGVFSLVIVWDLPILQTWLQFLSIFYGFHVGDAVISLRDILVAFVAFSVSYLSFRLVRRFLEEKVMPKLVLDSGVRYSMMTVFGYLGLLIPTIIALRIVGVSFQTISLMAGALFVGIGFGLRAVVENFTSGIILLFERPIKVGDMIEVGGVQGFVTRIHIRATQMMTFDRSEVVIPNAVLITSGVTNWTHTNRQARITINVSILYNANVAAARDLLLKVAGANQQVLRRPAPDVLLSEFGAQFVKLDLYCFIGDATMRLSVASQLRYDIEEAFRAAGIALVPSRYDVNIIPHNHNISAATHEPEKSGPR